VPALPPYIIEPIWQQFSALLPQRETNPPLGCHRARIPDRVVFEKLVRILVFGCAYRRIADEGCSATTLRQRREEWIELGVMDALRKLVLEAYDRYIGPELLEVAVDCCITKTPCGGQKAGRSPVDRGKQGIKRSVTVDAKGIPIGSVTAPANCHDSPLLIPTLEHASRSRWEPCSMGRACIWIAATTPSSLTSGWRIWDWKPRSPRRANQLRFRRRSAGWWSGRISGIMPIRSWFGAQSVGERSSISG
jgi:transposase